MAFSLVIASFCLALGAATAAPSRPAQTFYSTHGAPLTAVFHPGQVRETLYAGPAVAARTHVEHGIVGRRTIQVGSQTRQVGHQYVPAAQSVHQAPAYSYVGGAATVSRNTVPLPLAPLPVASPTAFAIPAAPRNLAAAPLDTVTRHIVAAPVRTHTVITPRRTRIEPELRVNRYPVEVPVAVPVPVEREVVQVVKVAKPYLVGVPQPVAVPAPYKVHPVQHVVETPVVHHQTYSIRQPVVAAAAPAAAAAPVSAYAVNGAAVA